MRVITKLAPIARALQEPSKGGIASVFGALEGLATELAALPASNLQWFGREEIDVIFGAVMESLQDRTPSFSAVPAPAIAEVKASHPRALAARMNNITSTRAGRILLSLAPYFAARDTQDVGLVDDAWSQAGLTYRKHVSFFASLLSSPEGRLATRLAASLAQAEWTERFWTSYNATESMDQLVVGNGPVGVAFAHSLIENGNFSSIIVSNAAPGGPFSWGQFPVNHRSRPTTPDQVGGPATLWALDDMGPVLISPSDINTTWGYGQSDVMAAVIALNALAAGPTITAEVTSVDTDYGVTITLENLDGQTKILRPQRTTFATGLGKPKELEGSGEAMSVQAFLAHPDPSSLGKRIAFVGGGDSAMMGIAHLLGLDGSAATPRQVQKVEEILWFRPEGKIYKETFPILERLRYGQIASFLPRLLDSSYPSVIKVIGKRVDDTYEEDRGQALVFDGTRRFADVVVNATGFESALDDLFYGAQETGEVIYDNGIAIARRLSDNEDANVFAIGACAELPVSEVELQRFPILGVGKLSANTAALFRTIPGAVSFGRVSAKEGQGAPAIKKLNASAKKPTATKSSFEPFEETFLVEGAAVVAHSVLLTRIKFLVGVLSEELTCPAPIAISIDMTGEKRVSISSIKKVPTPIIEEVLRPLFAEEGIRSGIAYLCRVPLFLERQAGKMLKRGMSATSMNLFIPVDNGKLRASAITLAA
ncbi:MAG: hypothetical protein V4436_01910 [Patescibacteria group bacterium]